MSRERTLHPAAWWLWALGLGAAASRTTNVIVLGLLISAAGVVVARRRGDEPWSGAFASAMRIGGFIIVARMILQLVFGPQIPGFTIVNLPRVPLPDWAAGVRVGGSTSLPSLVIAIREGMQLATIVVATGAANALASPTRLLRALPGVLYEAGVALTVALSFGPQMITASRRIRRARRLRGRPTRGIAGLRGMALPVLEGALEQAIMLAAAMDSRGYGRRGSTSALRVRLASLVLLVGLLTAALGSYLVLDTAGHHGGGALTILAAMALLVLAVSLGGASGQRTRYRPDPFGLSEWLVAACGIGPAVLLSLHSSGLRPETIPLQWPSLPSAAVLAGAIAILPGWLAPAHPALLAPAPVVGAGA